MILAILKDNKTNEIEAGVYDCLRDYNETTFSPTIETLYLTDFKVHGKNYKERKAEAEELAKEYQRAIIENSICLSYFELMLISNKFENIGKRYGLLQEFKENAIC